MNKTRNENNNDNDDDNVGFDVTPNDNFNETRL